MSQSSETTKRNEFLALGYSQQLFNNDYYTARVSDTHGVCVAAMANMIFVQFFPWGSRWLSSDDGHGRYASFICGKAASLEDKYKDLPYFKTGLDTDILTIKCLIEEGIEQCRLSSKSL